MAERKIKAREKIKEYSLEEFNSDFDGLSSAAKSDVLLKFYITQIHNKLRTEISEDQFDFGIVDSDLVLFLKTQIVPLVFLFVKYINL